MTGPKGEEYSFNSNDFRDTMMDVFYKIQANSYSPDLEVVVFLGAELFAEFSESSDFDGWLGSSFEFQGVPFCQDAGLPDWDVLVLPDSEDMFAREFRSSVFRFTYYPDGEGGGEDDVCVVCGDEFVHPAVEDAGSEFCSIGCFLE